MKRNWLWGGFAALSFIAAPSEATEPLLARTFAAHGGLDRWAEFSRMTYDMDGFPLSKPMSRPNTSTVDLRQRRNRIDGDGFVVAFDGQQAWADPGPEAVGLPSRFVTLGSFYFIGMPFVFGDDGVVLEDGGTGTFKGRTYRVVRVGYRRGTGYTSKDDYVLYIDPETDRLALIHHSVTENDDVDRVTWTFDQWQEVEGLWLPARMTLYPGFRPDHPGEGSSFTIEKVRLGRSPPPDELYARPDTAVVDPRPSLH
jgi:hypothetical protein